MKANLMERIRTSKYFKDDFGDSEKLNTLVIGATPNLGTFSLRSQEIHDYIQAQSDQMHIESWVAIDDMELITPEFADFMNGHFVKTDPRTALDRERAEKVVQLLNQ